jgi:hypothetical protein
MPMSPDDSSPFMRMVFGVDQTTRIDSFRQSQGVVYLGTLEGGDVVHVEACDAILLLQVVLTAIRLYGDRELARKVARAHLGE